MHERRSALYGLALFVWGAASLAALVSPSASGLGWAWTVFLTRAFGWVRPLAPLALMVGGAAVVARSLGWKPPQLEGGRWLGIGLLALGALLGLHAYTGAVDWATSMDIAARGQGAGWAGGVGFGLLASAFGAQGTWVILTGLIALGASLVTGVSLADAARAVSERVWRLTAVVRPRRSARSARASSDVAPAVPAAPEAGARPSPISRASAATGELGAAPLVAPASAAAPSVAWTLPDWATILEPATPGKVDEEMDRQRARLIEDTLTAFGAPAKVVEVHRGPTITQFGVEPEFLETRPGKRTKVKVSKISALVDDLALALAASSIRIEAPVPGKGYVGIEVPNPETSLVALQSVMDSPGFQRLSSRLRLGLGMDVSGRAIAADLAVMPHLLIAGTTGSGKSVCINALIACLLLQNSPDDLRFVMVDPKRVELTTYNGIPHLLAPVVVDLERVVPALRWISREMDERYRKFAREGVRHLADYNERMRLAGQRTLPALVVVIDELADLMMLAPDETERALTRLAQLARATGIHLVIATQRPSVDVVTGLIKANFPARIAFAVASSVDSRVILDQPGAERLLGRGDMLFQSPDAAAPLRMQGAFVSDAELVHLITFWKSSAASVPAVESPPGMPAETIPGGTHLLAAGAPLRQAPLWGEESAEEDGDALLDQAIRIVREMRRASISLLQRRLRIGYTRAARLIDDLETRGIVGPAQHGSQAREVLDYGALAAERD